jgi:hypothetical protein
MRVHFACELLLVDLTGTLSEISGATIDAITERWVRTDALSPAVRDLLSFTEPDPNLTLAEKGILLWKAANSQRRFGP